MEKPTAWGFDSNEKDPITLGIKKYFEGEEEKPIEHEALSVLIIRKILLKINTINKDLFLNIAVDSWIQDISCLLLKSIKFSSAFNEESKKMVEENAIEFAVINRDKLNDDTSKTLRNVLSNLISGIIDVDRMDYLLRDSKNCGVNYGKYDFAGIVNNLKIILDGETVKLGLIYKGVNALDDFLWSRYQMFKQVYSHKTNNVYNLLLSKAMEDLHANQEIKKPENLNDYIKLTDDFVMAMVYSKAFEVDPPRWIKAFANRILPTHKGSHESDIKNDIWKKVDIEKDPKAIYGEFKRFDKYPGWENDNNLLDFSGSKAEVIKMSDDNSGASFPTIIYFNKILKIWSIRGTYLEESVFFKDIPVENRMKEIQKRFNIRRIDFFLAN